MLERRRFKWALILTAVAFVAVVAVPLRVRSATVGSTWQQTLEQVIDLVEARYKDPVDHEQLLKGAVKGALESLEDPHTNFMDLEEYQDFMNSIAGEVSGIGIFIEKQGDFITVISPVKGSPAQDAGLHTGDRILAAGAEKLVGVPLEKAAKSIRGKPGTRVKITVERPSESRTFTIEVTRAQIEIPVVEYELMPRGIGYIKLNSFSADAPVRVTEAVAKLNASNVRGMILDLRGNPGGLLESAIDVAGVFLPRGTKVVEVVGRDRQPQAYASYGGAATVPLAVLVDQGSASASEIVAGALQDHERATVVGETTFGKGTVQNLLELENRGFLHVTIAEYRTPKGRKVDGQGIQPDVLVKPEYPNSKRLEPLQYERLLMRGSVGLDVLAIQQRVHDLGNYLGSEDGYFGGALALSIEALQREGGLDVHGWVDKPTLAKLNERVAAYAQTLRQKDTQKEKAAEILHDRATLTAAP